MKHLVDNNNDQTGLSMFCRIVKLILSRTTSAQSCTFQLKKRLIRDEDVHDCGMFL